MTAKGSRMLPMHLIAGLLLGGPFHRSPRPALAVALAASVLWGVGVGVANESGTTFVGGTLLAAANVAVGMLVGGVLRAFAAALGQRQLESDRPRP